jgi:hypothetical protein
MLADELVDLANEKGTPWQTASERKGTSWLKPAAR